MELSVWFWLLYLKSNKYVPYFIHIVLYVDPHKTHFLYTSVYLTLSFTHTHTHVGCFKRASSKFSGSGRWGKRAQLSMKITLCIKICFFHPSPPRRRVCVWDIKCYWHLDVYKKGWKKMCHLSSLTLLLLLMPKGVFSTSWRSERRCERERGGKMFSILHNDSLCCCCFCFSFMLCAQLVLVKSTETW